MFHLNPGWVAASVVAIAFVILYPLVLAVIANRRLKVSWKYFAFCGSSGPCATGQRQQHSQRLRVMPQFKQTSQ